MNKFEASINGIRHRLVIQVLSVILFAASCTTPKEFVYLNDIDSLKDTLLGPIRPFKETIIKPEDQISIYVTAYSPEDVQMFNSLFQGSGGQSTTQMGRAQTNPAVGYIVDKNGMVTLPYIGEFLAAGLTLREMEIFLSKQLERFVKQPIVKVRFINHFITVIGDVGGQGQGQIPMVTEQMTLFDVLARAGGLNITAIRDNILVVREENGYRRTGRVNVLSKTVYDNPYFYLQNRDMVYVEPVQASYINRSERLTKALGPFTAITGIIALVFTMVQLFR
jgi:polysaccharide export outer membrane protein